MPNILETYGQAKQPRPIIKNPQLPEIQATFLVAITMVLLTFGGTLGILILYLIWLPRFFYRKRFIPHLSGDVLLIYAFLGFCLMSVIWSDYRSVSLRAALELISMTLIAVVIARLTSTSAFIKGLAIGASLVFFATFTSGHFSTDSIFGSKNQAGYVAEIGIYASAVYLFSANKKRYKVGFLATFFFCLFCLMMSHSATSVVSLAVAMIISVVGSMIGWLPRRIRWLNLAVMVVLGSIGGFAAANLGLQAALFQGLGKDTTLTGRTYLWEQGIKIALQNPVFGCGYNAFWVQGRPQAEQFWYEFFIFNRGGFHFHDLYIETFVELGGIGLALIAALVIYACWQSLRYVMHHDRDLRGIFCLGMSFLLLIRTFVEVDFLGQFGIGQLLFFGILPRLAKRPQAGREKKLREHPQ